MGVALRVGSGWAEGIDNIRSSGPSFPTGAAAGPAAVARSCGVAAAPADGSFAMVDGGSVGAGMPSSIPPPLPSAGVAGAGCWGVAAGSATAGLADGMLVAASGSVATLSSSAGLGLGIRPRAAATTSIDAAGSAAPVETVLLGGGRGDATPTGSESFGAPVDTVCLGRASAAMAATAAAALPLA